MYLSKKYHHYYQSTLEPAFYALVVVAMASVALGIVFIWSNQVEYNRSPQHPNLSAALPYAATSSVEFATSTSSLLDSLTATVVGTEKFKIEEVLFEYVEVKDSCGPHFEGECVNARSGPGTEYDSVAKLRNHVVLKVDGKVEREGETWYKIIFDEWLRYPERAEGDWYVSANYVNVLYDEGDMVLGKHTKIPDNDKEIVVDRDAQHLYAYEDGELFMDAAISTGLELTPTPAGTFTVFKKTPSRYMQGPLPSLPADQYYDLPGVPWNLYFTNDGAVIHGTYWHTSFGSPYSHGCVNLSPEDARKLYDWADLGTKVTVK